MSVYYVYIFKTVSKKGRFNYYTGYTNNLLRRLKEHRNGKGAKFCRGKTISLEYFKSYKERKEAMNKELEIKQLSHKEKELLIKNFRQG